MIKGTITYKDGKTAEDTWTSWESLTAWMVEHWGEFDGVAALREEDEV